MRVIVLIAAFFICSVVNAQQRYQPNALTRFVKTGSTWVMQYDSLGNGTWVAVPSIGYMQSYVAQHAGGGNPNSNIGSGYRLAVPNTNNIKTISVGVGNILDSIINANSVTVYSDTLLLSTRAWRQKGIDSVMSVVGTTYIPLTRTINGKALSSNITLSLASSDFSNQGTATTVLHGNASGNPSWSSVIEADMNLSDNTTNNASILRHGFLPKLSNSASQYLDGTGNWSTPPGGTANLSIGTRTASILPINNSNGSGVNLPLVDASNAGLASPSMYSQYLNSFNSYTIRNANTSTSYFKLLYVPNDSTGIIAGVRIYSTDSKLTVDTSASNDSSKVAALTVNAQSSIQFRDEGTALGTPGTATVVNFTGSGVTATRSSDSITVAISGGGGSLTFPEDSIVRVLAVDTVASGTYAAINLAPYSAYRRLDIEIHLSSAVNGGDGYFELSTDGTTYATSGYAGYVVRNLFQLVAPSTALSNIKFTDGANGLNDRTTLYFTITNPGLSTQESISFHGAGTYYDGNPMTVFGTCNWTSPNTVKGIRFHFNNGNAWIHQYRIIGYK